MILGVDPGHTQSAVVLLDGGRPHLFKTIPNEDMLYFLSQEIQTGTVRQVAIEMIASYGLPVGREVFETCVFIGRLVQVFKDRGTEPCLVYRKDVKMHLCHSMKANDATIRQALIDRYGPGKEKAIGTKKSPGPLYKMKGDEWAALGVAVTYAETKIPNR